MDIRLVHRPEGAVPRCVGEFDQGPSRGAVQREGRAIAGPGAWSGLVVGMFTKLKSWARAQRSAYRAAPSDSGRSEKRSSARSRDEALYVCRRAEWSGSSTLPDYRIPNRNRPRGHPRQEVSPAARCRRQSKSQLPGSGSSILGDWPSGTPKYTTEVSTVSPLSLRAMWARPSPESTNAVPAAYTRPTHGPEPW